MRLLSARSLQLQLALRLAALYVAATAIVVAVLIYQAYSTADTLTDEDLNRRAEEIAGFVTINDSGEPLLDLPPKFAATYGASAGPFFLALIASVVDIGYHGPALRGHPWSRWHSRFGLPESRR
jgi:hypothetical protein